MLKEYTFVYKILFHDDEGKLKKEYGVINADTFKEASEMLEDFYGNDLKSMELNIIGTAIAYFNKETYESLMEFYKEEDI